MNVRFYLSLISLLLISACDQPATVGIDPVLAKVGDSIISRSQYMAMLNKLHADMSSANAQQIESVILQGLVRTRALALAAEQQLGRDEKQQLEAKVQAYRDELLVQAYIDNNIAPKPVTSSMVEDYYRQHIDAYTMRGKLGFEYLATTTKKISDDMLDQIMAAFNAAGIQRDWSQYAHTLTERGLPVHYRSALLPPAAIDKNLSPHLTTLKKGEVSDLIHDDYIYLAKLTQREADRVKPLHEVSVEIRRKLAPQQLKQTLAQHIDDALQAVVVEYTK